MDWFHCNLCFLREDTAFYVTSCGHILCQMCVTRDYCSVCRTACKYLALSENLKPQEKIFFRGLKETAQKYFDHIAQVWSFQKQQGDLTMAFYKQHLSKTQNALQEALLKIDNQERELKATKRDNTELRSLVSLLKGSLSRSQSSSRSCTPRPVAITSPTQTVTPRHSSQHCSQVVSRSSSVDSIPYRVSRSGERSSASTGRVQDRTTPITPSHGSPMSGHSGPYRFPSHSSSMVNFPFLGEQSTDSVDRLQTHTDRSTPRIYSGDRRESSVTPGSSTDRLRAIQLTFTPRTPGSHHSRGIPDTIG
ncbi:E3 ubiquitin-protein ligase RNF212B isoform X2 [Ascaphus truei]|uniref:E3 ubiquitin-protein ligase RNF212B isoform X2 n=1 Tax=Ascaphus truei TaxID=8439 RepID=UPI003F59C9BE